MPELEPDYNLHSYTYVSYWLNADKIGDSSLCGSYGTCLDCMLPEVQLTAGRGFTYL